MSIEVYHDVSGFETLAGEWNALLRQSFFNTIFLTWEWQTTWWEYLGQGDLSLVAVRDGGQLVGIAPLYVETLPDGVRDLEFVGCTEVSDYLDCIVMPGHEEVVFSAVMDVLDAQAAQWDRVSLCNIPSASPTHQALSELAEARGYRATIEVEDVCPVISLPATWEDYLSMLDKKQRHEVRRKIRRLGRETDYRWYIVGQDHDLAAEMDDFIALHQKSAADKEDFMDAQMQAFFHGLAQILHPQGWLQLAFIVVNGQKAATMLNFDYDDTIFVYNSGYDPDRHAWLSPGIVLLTYCIQQAIALGRKRFDFLQGDEAYKYRFGAQETRVYRLTVEK